MLTKNDEHPWLQSPLKLLGATSLSMAMFFVASSVGAQSSGGGFEISKHSIDNGGGRSTGGSFELNGTIAQPDATSRSAVGGPFLLTGGFWANGVAIPTGDLLFSDGFEGN